MIDFQAFNVEVQNYNLNEMRMKCTTTVDKPLGITGAEEKTEIQELNARDKSMVKTLLPLSQSDPELCLEQCRLLDQRLGSIPL